MEIEMPYAKTCEYCHSPFEVRGLREFQNQRFCSRSCMDASGDRREPQEAVHKHCEFCGKGFDVKASKASHQRFCSDLCAMREREKTHIEKTCEQCGTAFTVTRTREADRRFCGKSCQTAHEAIHGRPAARYERKETTFFTCKQCGNPFSYKPGYLAEYRRKYGKEPMYCSIPCSALGRKADTDAKHVTTCKNCGKSFTKTRRASGGVYREHSLCSRQCKNEWVSKVYREKHGLPQITRRIKRGYAVLRFPAQNGVPMHEILEHRYVMEQFLGRPLLPTETVHHKRAWDKTTNDMENLELRTGNHGPGGAVEDLVPWCAEMLALYPQFITPEIRERLKEIVAPPD
jgi:hypothetical protein